MENSKKDLEKWKRVFYLYGMKDKKAAKTVKVSDGVHAELKVHVAKKQVGITEFVDKAIANQIKRETK